TGGGRDHLVNALFINGMTEAEAKQLVPAAPNLRYTVTSGATPATNSKEEDKTTDFGGDFSQLQGLGKRLQGFYGKGYFPVSQINSKNEREEVRIDFDAMSVTQKHEFIEKALEHARTKYRELSSKVRTRTYVTSANYAGATTSSEVVYDFDSIPAATYHHENGSSGKVTTPRQEYDFLSGLNGDTVRSVNYGNGVSGYNARGSELVKGDGLNGSSGAFNNWAVLLSEHKAELKRAEESYSGGIRTYTRNLAFLNNSMQQNHLHAVALLSRTENSLNIRDLRKFTGTASNDDVVRLSGDWNADETVFTLRALPNKKGELVALPTAVAINIVTGEGMAEALQKMDNIRTAPAQDQAKAASPVVVSNLDRAGKIPSATLSRKRRDGSEIINQFAGRYEGNKFIATGLVQRGSLTFPKIPADKLLPYRKRDDYALEGKNALSGTYLMRGRIFRDVKLKGPDGSVKIYVVETGSGWEKRPLIGIGLKEEGYDRANLAWYQEDSDAHLLSHTVVKLSYNEIGNYDSHYIAAAQDAAARMDNAVIQRENENRRKTFESNLTDIERKAITPLAQGELVVSDVNKAEDWEVLTNNLRYHAGNVTDKATAHKDDPFKASKHMVEISDRDLNLSSRVILHGTYNKETKQFVMEGYELRHDGIPGDKPGQYVTKAATIDMHKRNFAETFAHVNKELNTGLRAEFKKDNDYFLVRDNRKPGLPQNLMMKFTPAQGGNYELEYCVNYCDDDMITVDAFCVGVTPKSEGIIISGADYEALKEGRKSMDTLLDKMDTLAKGKIAVKLKETDYREKMTLTITDNRSDIPKTYDITMKYDDAKKAIVTESISTGGKTVMKQVVMGDLNKPKTWTDLIDGAQELRTANLGAMPGIKSMRDQLAGLSAQQGVEVKTMPTAASYMPAIANLNALSQPIILAA
ncbi:MAG: hypothetical protein EBV03_05215, partial [Proteobacteria bacterium]|nr:hypothetical protein [Pseudomonadota bacterium]